MKRMLSITAAAILFSGTAVAQQGDSQPIDGASGYGEAFAALEASQNLDLSGVDENAVIAIVPLASLEPVGEADADAFANMRENLKPHLDDAREQVSRNEVIMSVLDDQGYAADDVVAVWNDIEDREVTLFVEGEGAA